MTKYHDEEWLEEQLVEKDRNPGDVAEECGVQKETIFKWRKKLGVGEQYECEVCGDEFPTERGRNIHHKKSHQLSTGGFIYECESCEEEFSSPRAPDDPKAPRFCGQGCYGDSIEGDENPNKDPDRAEKIGEGLAQAYREGRKETPSRRPIEVECSGNVVDSSWEAEVDRLLHSSDVEYHYNGQGQYKRYDLGAFTHAPDFIIPCNDIDIILEVKGGIGVHFQEEKMKKICRSMSEMDDAVYILYGDVNLPDVHHIEYGEEKQLHDMIMDLVEA